MFLTFVKRAKLPQRIIVNSNGFGKFLRFWELLMIISMHAYSFERFEIYQKVNVQKFSKNDEVFIKKCLNLTDSDSGIPNSELAQLKRLVNQNPKANAVYARQMRKFDGDLLGALNTAGSQILPEKIFKNWVDQQRLNFQAASNDFQKQSEAARKRGDPLPKKPEKQALYADFPPVTDWTLTPENFECATETVCAIAELGQKEKAFKICETLAQREGVEGLAIHEAYAEIRSGFEEYKEALSCLKSGEEYAKIYQKDYRNADKAEFNARLKRYQILRDRIKRLSAIPQPMKWYQPDLSEDGILLLGFERQINEGSLSQKDFDALKKKVSELSGKQRIYAVMLIARCARIAEDDPGKALTILIPLVTEKSVSEAFIKNYRDTFKKSMNGYNAAVQKKEKPPVHPLESLQIPLPEVKNESVNDENGCVIVEIARSLHSLGKNAEAVSLLLEARPKLKCADAIAATVLGGRLFLAQNELKKANDFCKHALSMLPHLATQRDGRTKADKSGVTDRLRSSAIALQGEIAYRMETEKFGEGFVVYREAERARLEQKNFVRAYELYQRVLTADSGVYAEAANAYIVKCLLHFGTEEGTAELKKFIDERSKVLDAKTQALKELKKAKLLGGFNRKLQKSIDQNQKNLNRLRTLPSGAGALKTAIALTEKALGKNEFGLYRGEMLTDIGLFFADENCDFKNAEIWLTRAENWFERAEKTDANLNEFSVFGEAARVTQPPEKNYKVDNWENVGGFKLAPGMLFNRQTSTWYAKYHRGQIMQWQGFFAFVEKDFNKAMKCFKSFEENDERSAYVNQKKIPGIARRLQVCVEERFFRDADAKQLQYFKDKHMLKQILLADYLAEIEEFDQSLKTYKKLLFKRKGKITPDQEIYLRYSIAWTMWYRERASFDRDLKPVEALLTPILLNKKLQETLWAPKALAFLAGIKSSLKKYDEAGNLYKMVYQKYPKDYYGELSLYGYALYHLKFNEKDGKSQCIKYLSEYIKKYPKGYFLNVLKQKMVEIGGED